MVLYSTGMRNRELRNLQVKDIDSRSMLIHIQYGKGGRDRFVPLSSKLLETLREYWCWMRPKTWLFPGTVNGWRTSPLFRKSFGRPAGWRRTGPESKSASILIS
jgi:integrase